MADFQAGCPTPSLSYGLCLVEGEFPHPVGGARKVPITQEQDLLRTPAAEESLGKPADCLQNSLRVIAAYENAISSLPLPCFSSTKLNGLAYN